MLARDGEEAKEVAVWGDRGADGVGLLSIWETSDGGLFIPVLGTNVVFHWRRLSVGGTEPPEGAGGMGAADEDLGKLGSG